MWVWLAPNYLLALWNVLFTELWVFKLFKRQEVGPSVHSHEFGGGGEGGRGVRSASSTLFYLQTYSAVCSVETF